MMTHPHLTNNHNIERLKYCKQSKSTPQEESMVCARINRPWNGARKFASPTMNSLYNVAQSSSSMNDNHNQQFPIQNRSSSLQHQQLKLSNSLVTPKKMPWKMETAVARSNNVGTTYQQYLSEQQLMPTKDVLQQSPMRRNINFPVLKKIRKWIIHFLTKRHFPIWIF